MSMVSEAPVPPSMLGAESEWNGLVRAIMAHAGDVPDKMAAAIDRAPDSPALASAKGLMFLLLGRRELATEAASLAAAAKDLLAGSGDAADATYVKALQLWVGGRPSEAAALFDRHLGAQPGDAFALKMAQAIRFLYGDAKGMHASASAAIGRFADSHPHAGYAHGIHAFACEEAGELALAERAGLHALELAGDDAWGLHAVAHVHEMRGHADKGRTWLQGRPEAFAHCTTFGHHVWWHLALFELELGNIDAVFDLYDNRVRREHTDDYRDIANAVSLLARLEGEGVEVGERWDELSAIAEGRIEDGCVVFADLHYLLALLGSGNLAAADRLVERMAQAGEASEFSAVAVRAGAPAGAGLGALARGRNDDALDSLLAARTQLTTIGGSHAQRDVFERLTIDAALRAGRLSDARSLIKDRAQRRGAYDRFGFERLLKCGPANVSAPPATTAAF